MVQPLATPEEYKARRGVFVSYARKDGEAFAIDLRDRLLARNISVWQDRAGLEGGRDWWEQIKDALGHVEYIVLVMTPAAMRSEVVRKEWRYARQQGVCVYPVIADASIDIASLPRWMSSIHWYDLAHQEEKFFNDLNTRCQMQRVPFMAEPLPEDFVPRRLEFEQLKKLLLSPDKEAPVAITAAFRGAGGFGKTTLARAICSDDDIQNAFDDGILWVTLGEAPSAAALLGKLNDLIETLSGERPSFEGVEAAATRFRELLADRDILLVVDDVWRAPDVRPFLTGGARCARLITTRRGDVVPSSAAKVSVDQMSATEAVELLSKDLPAGHETAFRALAARLGEWPLLLKLANSWLHKRIRESRQPVDRALGAFDVALTKRGVTAFDPQNSVERNDAVSKTLELSLFGLAEADQRRLLELAVFEEDLHIPLSVLARFWAHTGGLDELEVEETCQRLFGESFLVDFSLEERFVRLHDSIRAWLIGRLDAASLPERHGQLLASYERVGQPWHEVPDDGYVRVHLARHLVSADRQADLQRLLLDVDWIEARLLASRGPAGSPAPPDVFGLLSDYDTPAPTPDLTLVRCALQASTHIIAAHPDQVGLQLYGRLGTSDLPAVRELCQIAIAREQSAPLLPLLPALNPPGPLVLTFAGHEIGASGAMLLAEGRKALSWSSDRTLKLWDLERGELLHALADHGRWVYGATLLAEGRQALSWAQDGTLKLWDLERGELLHTYAGHEDEVNGAALLAEGRQALSWSGDGTLKLWDLERGELLHTYAGHEDEVSGATLLAESRQALSWSGDGTLKLWDLERGELLQTYAGHEDEVNGAALLAEGRQALSWSGDGTLKLWDLKRGELLQTLGGHEDGITNVTLLAEGRKALSWSVDNGTLRLWDLERGELLHVLAGHERGVYGAELLAEGRKALSWSVDDRALKLWDLERGELLHALAGHERGVCGATLLAEGRKALSWSSDGTLKLWDLERGELLHTYAGHEDMVYGVALLAEGRQALSWSGDRTFKLWDLERGELLQALAGHERGVSGATLLAEGRQALSWSGDGTLKLWDLECGELLHVLAGHERGVYGATLQAEGRKALSWSVHDGIVKLWDLERGELLHTLTGHQSVVTGAALLAEGRQALLWSFDSTLKLWDLERGELLHTFAGHESEVSGATLLAKGWQALSWSSDRTLKLWDLERGELLHTLAGHEDLIIDVTLLAEGRQALSWSCDGTVRLWDLERGELLHTLAGHERGVTGATLLAEGRQALSWSFDGTLKLWDLERGELLQTYAGQEGEVTGATLLVEGRQALSWSVDGTLKLWDLERGELLYTLAGHEDGITDVTVLAEGRQALSCSKDRSVRLWDLGEGRCIGFYVTDFAPSKVVVGLGGRRVFIGDNGGRMHLLCIVGATSF
ncbi:TIR domain-containing protein [Variovorax sp. J22R115]|uniref:TIR domain-containing protein n=1 Tax=Variovorax sp. J22R115 TaxID=3053509 RepID=UPI002577F7E6|nr:TIR domain-containing protein [Variovorax sp. J22R115]MDM0048614.1 TIR domain-containing protein [Variovorax sp. J22R115]